jgi:hypothetical protein
MITEDQLPEEENNDLEARQESEADTQKSTSISLPNIKRPDGPFEHSGETAGWTHEEEAEKADEKQEPENT